MNIGENFKSALWSLQANKLRSFLSMLGIIIGVAAVVAVVSISNGAQDAVLNSISQLGSNLIMINTTSTIGRAANVSGDSSQNFTVELANQLGERAPALISVAPQAQGTSLLMHGGSNLRASMLGVVPSYQEITNYQVALGRFIHVIDNEQRNNVVVLGSQVATDLFGTESPLGEEVRLVVNNRRYNFLVVGVMEVKGQVMMGNYDSQVYVPITTAMERLLRIDQVTTILAQSSGDSSPAEAVAQTEFFLQSRLGREDGFRVTSQEEMLETMSQVTQILRLMLASIAGISLLVGGIGVMNIMLVSVTERTQEIGTRKALGAKQRDLLGQFLVEAIILTCLGGILGLLLGSGMANLAGRFGGWPVALSSSSLVIAIGFSAAIGLFAGVYPAMKAAKLDPVAALSYE